MLLETEDKATIERVSNRAGAVVQINFAYFNHAKVNFELKVQAVLMSIRLWNFKDGGS